MSSVKIIAAIVVAAVVLLAAVIVTGSFLILKNDSDKEASTDAPTSQAYVKETEASVTVPSEAVTETVITRPHVPADIYGYNVSSEVEKPYEYCYYEPMLINSANSCYLNSESDMDCKKLYGPLISGSLVYKVGYSADGEWSLVYCRYENIFGWLQNRVLLPVDSADVTTVFDDGYIVSDGNRYMIAGSSPIKERVDSENGLALRSGPGDNERTIFAMEDGAVITVGCRYLYDTSWAYVVYDDGIGQYCGFADASYFEGAEDNASYASDDCTDMINAYCATISCLYESGDMFCNYVIYDIDQDGTTELIYQKGSSRADARFIVYTYDKNQAVRLGEFGGDTLYRTESSKGVYSYYCQMGGEIMYLITKNGASLAKDTVFQRQVQTYSPPDDRHMLRSYEYNDTSGVFELVTSE